MATGFVGAGAQVVVFTVGRGTPIGSSFVQVIKVSGNDFTCKKMRENIDINTGTIISQNVNIKAKGWEIFQYLQDVAGCRKTKAEILRHDKLSCIARV